MSAVRDSFRTHLTYTHQSEWTIFFSDLLNLARIVTFGKQHLGHNVIRNVAWEIVVFWKLFSRRRVTTVAW